MYKILCSINLQWKKNKESILTFFGIAIMFALNILNSIGQGHYVNFWPINGTFQNYNPVRRFLSGQIPYRDFQDYLGLGHLYSGTILTKLFGGDYQASLMAFAFLTFLCLSLIFITVGFAVMKKKIVVAFTNLVLVLLLSNSLFFSNIIGNEEIKEALEYALGTGNSARFIRGLILPISCFALEIFFNLYEKHYNKKYREVFFCGGIGIISGFCFIWSNDYGISCWVCLIIMTFAILVSKTRHIGKSFIGTMIEVFISIVCILIFAEILTVGNGKNWIKDTLGTGGYQSWYYNSSKSYFLYDVDFSYIMLVQAFLSLVYLVKLFCNRADYKAMIRYSIPAFMNMVSFCAVNEYQLLSGGGAREVALTVLFATVFFEICEYIVSIDKEKICRIITISSIVCGLAWIASTSKNEILFWSMSNKGGMPISSLGGNITFLGEDLLKTSDFLDDESFFATYASAQEVVEEKFQPSGVDYIIHVLGDKKRQEYLDDFINGNFKYAATMKEEFTPFEYWIQRANWFFYRELYRNWHPVYANTYEIYWERNGQKDKNFIEGNNSIIIEELNEDKKKIIVQADSKVNGTADVYVNYEVKESEETSNMLFQKMLHVQNTGVVDAEDPFYESNYLRSKGAEHIPVPLVDGYGEVTLTSQPEAATKLEVYQAKCEGVYLVESNYMEISDFAIENEEMWLIAMNNSKNRRIIEGISAIEIAEQKYTILDKKLDESGIYMSIGIDNNNVIPELLINTNVVRLVR